MATTDRLCVHTYKEYDELRKWAIAYYPELLFYFFDVTINPQQWEDGCKAYVKREMDYAKREYDKLKELGDPLDRDAVAIKKFQHYAENGGYISLRNAIENVNYILECSDKTASAWEKSYSVPIMFTPHKVNRKLLWICPVPCVREYLETDCGYETRWYHKLFWKGKKHF